MSEKSTAAKHVDVESAKMSEKATREMKGTKTMEEAKKIIHKAIDTHQTKTSRSTKAVPKTSTSSKPEDPEATRVCQISKMSKISTCTKPKDPEAVKTGQMPKTTSEISTSFEPETPKVPKEYQKDTSKVSEEMSKTTSEISTSIEPEAPKIPEVCQMSKTTSKISTSAELEAPKIPEVCQMSKTTSKISTSAELETPKIPEVCQMSKTTSKISTSAELEALKVPEVCQMSKTMSEMSISAELEDPKVPEVCQMSKTTSEISTSAELEAPKVPEVCQMSKTTSEISTSAELEAPKVPEVCQMSKTMSEMSISAELEAPKIPEVCQMSKTTPEMSISAKLKTSKSADCEVSEMRETPKIMSEMSTSSKLETPKVPEELEIPEESDIPELCPIIKNMSKILISNESEDCKVSETRETPEIMSKMSMSMKCPCPLRTSIKVPEESEFPEVCQITTMSEKSTCTKYDVPEFPRIPDVCDLAEMIKTLKKKNEEPEIPILPTRIMSKISASKAETEKPEVPEVLRTRIMSKISASKAETEEPEIPMLRTRIISKISASKAATEEPEIPILRTRIMSKISASKAETEEPEVPEVRQMCSTASQIVKFDDFEIIEAHQAYKTMCKMSTKSSTKSEDETNSAKDIKDDNSEAIPKKYKESSIDEMISDNVSRTRLISILEQGKKILPRDQKLWMPLKMPDFKKPYLVLATQHMVPSLPIELFEVFAEMIEVVTERPVALLHECREKDRPIATEIVDIAVLPAGEDWQDGVLLPASFVFEHHYNTTSSAGVYVDILVTNDRAPHIKDVLDLRGYKCAIPHQPTQFSAAGLLFNHLHSKGENMIFFGHLIGASTQLRVLEMVTNKYADAGILESPVIRCHKHLPGIENLHILGTLGPLPPYRIMVKKQLADKLNEKLTNFMLNFTDCERWLERMLPFGVVGFAKNSMDNYSAEKKNLVVNVPYY